MVGHLIPYAVHTDIAIILRWKWTSGDSECAHVDATLARTIPNRSLPIIITIHANHISSTDLDNTSPYPVEVIVDTVQYILVPYNPAWSRQSTWTTTHYTQSQCIDWVNSLNTDILAYAQLCNDSPTYQRHVSNWWKWRNSLWEYSCRENRPRHTTRTSRRGKPRRPLPQTCKFAHTAPCQSIQN